MDISVNRKLIRPTLAEIKEKGRDVPHKEQANGDTAAPSSHSRSGGTAATTPSSSPPQTQRPSQSPGGGGGGGSSGGSSSVNNAAAVAAALAASSSRSKRIPPSETYAEIFYYKKQMDAHTPMVIVLRDGEEIEGTIEWYDREALKVNRHAAPNILLLKHNIKYMFKADEREAKP
ncbi:MAG: hypothetical protein WKF30_00490 [Pyrinomonadaceae bacterium]